MSAPVQAHYGIYRTPFFVERETDLRVSWQLPLVARDSLSWNGLRKDTPAVAFTTIAAGAPLAVISRVFQLSGSELPLGRLGPRRWCWL